MRLRTPAWGAIVVCLGLLSFARNARAATIAVPAGGDLQAALNAAVPGDVITLAPGAVYAGNFTLPNKGASDLFITIRSAAPDASLPPDGVRMTPQYAAQLPIIRSTNSMSAMRTKTGSHHWKLMFLEFRANVGGYGDILALGAADTTQTLLSQVPYNIVVDRVYMHGDPVMGQKRGISLNSRDTQVLNSYIADIKGVGFDSQAIASFNGPGNYVIENNYLEAAGENVLIGGADPTIPSLVATNLVFRRNHMRKPVQWRDPIIPTPQNITATAAVGAGTLGAGTYAYKVVARIPAGQTTKAASAASAEVSAALPSTGGVTIAWTPVTGATEYLVYGRTPGATNSYWKTTNPYFTDSGAAGTSGSPAASTKWTVKNIFELKNAQDVLVEGNVFENIWVAAQPGFAIVLTPRNQDGTAPWSVVQRVVFRTNLVRHAAGGLNILGTDNLSPSLETNNLSITGNIWDDINTSWGSGSKTIQIGDGGDRIVIDHNTIDTNLSTIVAVYGGSATSPTAITNFTYTNNMSEHRTYGIWGSGLSTGFPTINAYLPGSIIRRNVLAGGSASKYPADNFFPTVATWKTGFVNLDGDDYHLLASSPYAGAALDGGPLGADVDAVMAQASTALSGDNRLPSGANHVQIMTTSLPNGMLHQPYAQSLTCSGGMVPCAWQLQDAALPEGLSFDTSAGMLSGNPNVVETGTLTVIAYDPSWPSNSATTTLTVTIDPPPFAVTVAGPSEAQAGSQYSAVASASGAIGFVTWTVASGSLPDGVVLDLTSGAISGMPSAWGTSTALVKGEDSWQPGRADAKPLAIVVAPAPLAIATTSLGTGAYQQYFASLLSASGGSGSTTWAIVGGSLPAGLIADASGTISGTPTVVGSFSVTVQATDANWPSHQATATLGLTINPPVFAASMPSAPMGQVGAAYELAGSTSGQMGAVVWSVASGALPAGLGLNPSTGVVRGVPASAGTFNAVVQAVDSWDASRVVLMAVAITVAPTQINVATWTLPAGTRNRAYNASLVATGGTGLATWTLVAGTLPAGLSLALNGNISGTPTAAGTSAFTVRVDDAGWSGNSATATLSISVVSGDIVLYAADASRISGAWSLVSDPTAAAGKRMANPDAGAPKITAPLVSPANYFELTFQAQAGVAYHLWVRGKAQNNYYGNDSAFVQFSGSVTAAGAPINRIGTASALAYCVENGAGAGVAGWGWNDDAYDGFGSPIYFAVSGPQTIRFQLREDGLSIDQIVLSPGAYATASPGAFKNDTTIVPR